MIRVALPDDYQGVALESADWGQLSGAAEVVAFRDHLTDIDALAERFAPFDVVVTDLKMDGIDGFDLIKKGKRERRDLPFVLISGYGTSQTASLAAKEGADVFLAKPIDLVDLKTAVKKALRKKSLV